MAGQRESLSAQSARRTNWILLVGGLILIILFFMVLCSRPSQKLQTSSGNSNIDMLGNDFFGNNEDPNLTLNTAGKPATLEANPKEVILDRVSIGSKAEAIITLHAKDGNIHFGNVPELVEIDQEEGFELSGSCFNMERLDADQKCLIEVHWNPTMLLNYQNQIKISWYEDSQHYDWQDLYIPITGRSADLDKCVVCPAATPTREKLPQWGINSRGEIEPVDGPQNPLEKSTEPEKVPVGLNNRVIGVVERGSSEVIDANGQKIGTLLGDDTIVDSNFNVVGAAIHLTSVVDDFGQIIGVVKLEGNNLKVVDAKGMTIGTPRVDSTVVDYDGRRIGVLLDWGGALDLNGQFLGRILPDGRVVVEASDGKQESIGILHANRLVTDANGTLIGGSVPKGVGVSSGCRSFGPVLPNGVVKDNYGQTVGRAFLDGSILDADMRVVGGIVREGLIINEKGQLQGYISREGKALDKNGALIGCVDTDGAVRAEKTVVGGVMKHGMVVGRSCEVIGSVYPNGVVMNQAVEPVGYVRPDGYVANSEHQIIGAVVPYGTAIAEGCRLLGMISVSGEILDSSKSAVGCVTADQNVINKEGVEIGQVTPKGPVVKGGVWIGHIRLDGRIIDKERKVIGCVTDGEEVVTPTGVVLNDSGWPTEWTTMGGKCYSKSNEVLGDVSFNGWVFNSRGRIIGFVPPDGLIVSNDGAILGTYSSQIGMALDDSGQQFARVLPDLTVIDMTGNTIVGALIPLNSVGVSPDSAVLGKVTLTGFMSANNSGSAKVFADGRVMGSDGKVMGHILHSGPVLSALGKEVAWSKGNGEAVSKGSPVGQVLGNDLVLSSAKDQVIGRVWMPMSVLVNGAGLLGTAVPKFVSKDGVQSYQINAYDRNGSYLGIVSPFGVVFNNGGRLIGHSVPVTTVFDFDHNLIGWVSFSGEIIDKNGSILGVPTQNGLVMNQEGIAIGFLKIPGLVTNAKGQLLGNIAPDGKVIDESGRSVGLIDPSPYVFGDGHSVLGRRWPISVAIDAQGKLIGWMDAVGNFVDGKGYKGFASLDGRLWDVSNNVVGGVIPVGAGAISSMGESLGIVDEQGRLVSGRGTSVGSVIAPYYVIKNGEIVGRLLDNSVFANNILDASVLGQVEYSSDVYRWGATRPWGNMMTNGFIVDANKVISGHLVPMGLPQSTNLKTLGEEVFNGTIVLGGRIYGSTTGMGAIISSQAMVGGITPVESIVDKNGLWVALPDGSGKIEDKSGSKVGVQLALGAVLSPENAWVGNTMKTGYVVDDHGAKLGAVGPDGSVIGKDGSFKGRMLPFGSMALLPDANVYNSMPYGGHIVAQGLPLGYDGTVLGRTTLSGDVIDAGSKKVANVLDDGSILGSKKVLEGTVVPFGFVAGFEDVIGSLNGSGKVIGFQGEEIGFVDASGLIGLPQSTSKPLTEQARMEVLGTVISDGLISDDTCHVVGQASYSGAVINGQGNTVGRLQPDGWAEDASGQRIGRLVTEGPVLTIVSSAELGEDGEQQAQEESVPVVNYVGRTLPDGTVVNEAGVPIGCAKNDDTVVDSNGQLLGKVIMRGPVWGLGENVGTMIGRVDARGKILDANNTMIGFVDGNLRAFDNEGNEIGFATRNDSMVILDHGGELKYVMTKDGTIYNNTGKFLYNKHHHTKVMTGKYGEKLGLWSIDETYVFLYDLEDRIIARLKGCELFSPDGETLLGKLSADGTIKDINDEVYGSAAPNNQVYNPNGSLKGEFRGVGLDLRRCGLAGYGGTSKSGPIIIKYGNRDMILEDNLVKDPKTNKAIGYRGEDGRIHTFDQRPLDQKDEDIRPLPPVIPPVNPPPGWSGGPKLGAKRQQMSQKIHARGTLTIPGPEILAKAKKHQDKSWPGVEKTVSSWPVDMSNMILKDKGIPAVLVHSIDTRFNVPVTAIVERNIYAESGRNIIIPAGSRLIGISQGSETAGGAKAAKVMISWERLIRPDGAGFVFSGESADAQGRGGVPAYLDEQLFKKYANPFVTSIGNAVINRLVEWNAKSSGESDVGGEGKTYGQQTRQMFIDNFQQIFDQMMAEANNVQPILFVPSGTRLIAYPRSDLWLRTVSDDEEAMNAGMGSNVSGVSGGNWMNNHPLYDGNGQNSENVEYRDAPTGNVSDSRANSEGNSNAQVQNNDNQSSGSEEDIYEDDDRIPEELLDRTIDNPVIQQRQTNTGNDFM